MIKGRLYISYSSRIQIFENIMRWQTFVKSKNYYFEFWKCWVSVENILWRNDNLHFVLVYMRWAHKLNSTKTANVILIQASSMTDMWQLQAMFHPLTACWHYLEFKWFMSALTKLSNIWLINTFPTTVILFTHSLPPHISVA